MLSEKAEKKLLWERELIINPQFAELCSFPKDIWNVVLFYLRFTLSGTEWKNKFSGVNHPAKIKMIGDVDVPYKKLLDENVTMGLLCFADTSFNSAAIVLRNIDDLWILSFCGNYSRQDSDVYYVVNTPCQLNELVSHSLLKIVDNVVLEKGTQSVCSTLPLPYCPSKNKKFIVCNMRREIICEMYGTSMQQIARKASSKVQGDVLICNAEQPIEKWHRYRISRVPINKF